MVSYICVGCISCAIFTTEVIVFGMMTVPVVTILTNINSLAHCHTLLVQHTLIIIIILLTKFAFFVPGVMIYSST